MKYRLVFEGHEDFARGVFVNPTSFEPTILCVPGYDSAERFYKRLPSMALSQTCPDAESAEEYYGYNLGYGVFFTTTREADAEDPEVLARQLLEQWGPRKFSEEEWKAHAEKVNR